MIKKTVSIIVILIITITNNIIFANTEALDNNLYSQNEYTNLPQEDFSTKVDYGETNENKEFIVIDKVEGDSEETVYVEDYLQETEEEEDNKNKYKFPFHITIIKQNEKTKDKNTENSKTDKEVQLDNIVTDTNIEDLQGCPLETEKEEQEDNNKTIEENEQKEDKTVQTNQDMQTEQKEEQDKQINDVIQTTNNVKKLPRTGM